MDKDKILFIDYQKIFNDNSIVKNFICNDVNNVIKDSNNNVKMLLGEKKNLWK